VKKSWIASVKTAQTINSVASQLGMRTKNGNQYGPCPACEVERRGSSDKRLPIGVFRYGEDEFWRCFHCQAKGDIIDLVSYKICGMASKDLSSYVEVKEFFQLRNYSSEFMAADNSQAPKKEWPPMDDIKKIKTAMTETILSKLDHEDVNKFLRSRRLWPHKMDRVSLFPDSFPYEELTKVTTSTGKEMNFWPRVWAHKYPIFVPLYDVTGTMRSFQGRAIKKDVSPKSMCPAGYSMQGLFFANSSTLEFLRNKTQFQRFWIVEGEIDFLTMDQQVNDPVIGIKNSSISALAGIQFPKDADIIVCTHNDEAGEKYAKKIGKILHRYSGYVRLILPQGDLNDFQKKNQSLRGIEEYIVPDPDLNDLVTEDGVDALRKAYYSLAEAKKEERLSIFLDLQKRVDSIAAASREYETECTKYLLKIQAIRGCGQHVVSLKKLIRKQIKKMQQEEMSQVMEMSAGFGPHEDVVLFRKAVKVGDEVSHTGAILKMERNVINILTQDPRINDSLRYNELTDTTEYRGRQLEENAIMDVALHLQDHYEGFRMDFKAIGYCMAYVSEMDENRYNPAVDMLNDIYYNTDLSLAPDHARPENLFEYYFRGGVGDIPEAKDLMQNYSLYFLLSLVNRQYQPACRVEAFPVLIGPQGCGKSSGVRELVINDAFFSDTTFDIKSKDAFMQIKGNVLYEIAEGDSLSKGGVNFNTIKNFLTQREFNFRKPYKATVEKIPCNQTYVITSNGRILDFLSDPTGSRRFHTMYVGIGGMVRTDELKADMKYILARTLHMYYGTGEYTGQEPKKGFYLDKNIERLSQIANQSFAEIDPWTSYVSTFLTKKWGNWAYNTLYYSSRKDIYRSFFLSDVFDALNVPTERQDRRFTKRLTDILLSLGAERSNSRGGKNRKTYWYAPEDFGDLKTFDMDKWLAEDNE